MNVSASRDTLDRLVDLAAHPGSFIQDDENLAGMKALKPSSIVCRQTERVVSGPEHQFGLIRRRQDKLTSGSSQRHDTPNFTPNYFLDLDPGRRGRYRNAIAMGDYPPQDGDRDREAFSAGVAGFDRDPSVLVYGLQDRTLG